MKRRVLMLALFLVLFLVGGAIVNVSVAWTLTRLSKFTSNYSLGTTATYRLFTDRGMIDPTEFVQGHIMRGEGLRMNEGAVGGLAGNQQAFVYLLAFDAGWPLVSMRAEWRGSRSTVGNMDQSTVLFCGRETTEVARTGQFRYGQFAYPTKPLWMRFAINTMFYGVILRLLLVGPFALRKRLRIKRGLCPKCAYPVGTNAVCTECGAGVSPRPEGANECSHG